MELPLKIVHRLIIKHARSVWKDFEIDTMKDQHDLYLQVDILLLTCVFETF